MSDSDCIFCKIIKKEMPCDTVYEDDRYLVIKDINPKAPVHVLVIPKDHIPSLNHLKPDEGPMMAELILLLPKIAQSAGLNNGYRTVINTGEGGGQIVHHIHFHIMGGGVLPEL